jgi:glycine dehydrogenase subunit 1
MSYSPHGEKTVKDMLNTIGIDSIDGLYKDIPEEFFAKSFDLPESKSEHEVISYFKKIANKNSSDLVYFTGGGFYDHYVPPAVDYISGRGEFYTAYTPYQPEASQGTVQSLYEYQTSICELTGMDASNASLYDGGTAIVEAILMSFRITRKNRVLLDSGINPLYQKLIQNCFQVS